MELIKMPTQEELVVFVLHSNWIEGEPINPTHPLFQSHLTACLLVLESVEAGWGVPHPLAIHEVLMIPRPSKLPGQYRPPHDPEKGVPRVGKEPLIPAHLIALRMTDLMERVRKGPGEQDAEEWVWGVHVEFERIHPFLDGNGRTGRIHMNGLRLIYGLPWLTVRFEEREAYMARFR